MQASISRKQAGLIRAGLSHCTKMLQERTPSIAVIEADQQVASCPHVPVAEARQAGMTIILMMKDTNRLRRETMAPMTIAAAGPSGRAGAERHADHGR